jgi:N-sulfoglucosamine sulfohydrolase
MKKPGKYLLLILIAFVSAASTPAYASSSDTPLNVIMIAVDDMAFDTPESFGGAVKGLTPHIDALAAKGMVFRQAYNTSSRCAPSRGTMMTGLYQDAFAEKPGGSNTHVKKGVKTLPQYLVPLGYMTGLFGKDSHYRPLEKYAFDHVEPMAAMAVGRSPALYAAKVDAFIKEAKSKGKPFFISTNTHDPHRPFAGDPGELKSLNKRFKKEMKHINDKVTYFDPGHVEFIHPPQVTTYSGM